MALSVRELFAKTFRGTAMHREVVKDQCNYGGFEATEEIEVQVQSQLHGQVGDLHLFVCGQGLIIQGRRHTYYAKQIAQHAVMKATNLPILRNEIEAC